MEFCLDNSVQCSACQKKKRLDISLCWGLNVKHGLQHVTCLLVYKRTVCGAWPASWLKQDNRINTTIFIAQLRTYKSLCVSTHEVIIRGGYMKGWCLKHLQFSFLWKIPLPYFSPITVILQYFKPTYWNWHGNFRCSKFGRETDAQLWSWYYAFIVFVFPCNNSSEQHRNYLIHTFHHAYIPFVIYVVRVNHRRNDCAQTREDFPHRSSLSRTTNVTKQLKQMAHSS